LTVEKLDFSMYFMLSPKKVMERTRDAKTAIEEGELCLARGKPEQAHTAFLFARSVLYQLDKDAELLGKLGGPLVVVTVAELADFVRGGGHHPILDAAFGTVLGYFAGKKVAEYYSDGLTPLRVRALRGLGEACFMLERRSEAREHFAEALKAAPDDPVTRRKFAEAL
jgi:hypothetical protein